MGTQDNVFNLSQQDLRNRSVDFIDIVTDSVPPKEYNTLEDPRLYVSTKTGRGPLSDRWREDYAKNPAKGAVMCAYKLCRVEFKIWGLQSRIENFICDGMYGGNFYYQ